MLEFQGKHGKAKVMIDDIDQSTISQIYEFLNHEVFTNPDWNFSAPHGAGRLGSRRWAKETLNLDDAKHRMEKNNIFFSTLPKDELKGAYKDPSIIESAIEPTAIIIDRLKPIIAMKD